MNDTQEFIHTIALEAQTMEEAVLRCTQSFYDTPKLQGKKNWYAIGLESIDSEKSKDSENKKGVIRQMVDAIVAFIKRIVANIKKFFQANEASAKEQEQFLKTHKGPTEEQLVAATNIVIRKAQHSAATATAEHRAVNKTSSEVATLERQQKETTADLDEAIKRAEEYLGKKFTRQEIVKEFTDTRLEKITKTLGHKDTVLFCKSLENDFHSSWQNAVKAVEQLIKVSPKIENLTEMQHHSHDVLDAMMHCGDILKESEDGYNYETTLSKWIDATDSNVLSHALSYTSNRFTLEDAGNYSEGLSHLVESLKNESSEEAVENLRRAKKVMMDITPFIAMSVRIGYTHKTAYQVLSA
jgi:hypothetical protein